MEEYNLFDHGDILEHEAVDMIRERFPYYELVWKIYIGNGGKATKADIPGYSFDQKRQNFSEHTYTVLESIYIINQIIESKVFISKVSSFQEYLEFNKSFISFFAHLGRSRDNIIKAAEILQIGNENVTKIRSGLAETYKARCIVIHGKKIPLQLDEDGLIKIPILGTSEQKAFAWNDKTHNWPDAIGMDDEYVADTCEDFFKKLLEILNNSFALFFNTIKEELAKHKCEIKFEYNEYKTKDDFLIMPSGTSITSEQTFDVAKAIEFLNQGVSGKSSTNGRNGSSVYLSEKKE